jgi:hydroxymethylpyrimidine/phosphomethylpyrimidine kinase
MKNKQPPIVLVFAGNDPTGGAGLGADIETLAAVGCHGAPVITCLTVQDTHNVHKVIPLTGAQVFEQSEVLLKDLPINAIKIGLLGHVDIVAALRTVLLNYRHLPVIFDPILAAGGGKLLADKTLRQAIIHDLLPLTQIITPNTQEAYALTQATTLHQAAQQLLDYGCQFVCLTGTHNDTTEVVNTLYSQTQKPITWQWARLPAVYHGSGCTLAASLAGLLAQGKAIKEAVYEAQQYTWTSLQRGYQPSQGQYLPYR